MDSQGPVAGEVLVGGRWLAVRRVAGGYSVEGREGVLPEERLPELQSRVPWRPAAAAVPTPVQPAAPAPVPTVEAVPARPATRFPRRGVLLAAGGAAVLLVALAAFLALRGAPDRTPSGPARPAKGNGTVATATAESPVPAGPVKVVAQLSAKGTGGEADMNAYVLVRNTGKEPVTVKSLTGRVLDAQGKEVPLPYGKGVTANRFVRTAATWGYAEKGYALMPDEAMVLNAEVLFPMEMKNPKDNTLSVDDSFEFPDGATVEYLDVASEPADGEPKPIGSLLTVDWTRHPVPGSSGGIHFRAHPHLDGIDDIESPMGGKAFIIWGVGLDADGRMVLGGTSGSMATGQPSKNDEVLLSVGAPRASDGSPLSNSTKDEAAAFKKAKRFYYTLKF